MNVFSLPPKLSLYEGAASALLLTKSVATNASNAACLRSFDITPPRPAYEPAMDVEGALYY
jgi:hypothetical protein